MTNTQLVDGDGWISDESDFYGDDATKAHLEDLAQRKLELPNTYFPSRMTTLKQLSSGGAAQTSAVGSLSSRPQTASRPKSASSANARPLKARNEIEAAEVLEDDRYDGSSSAKHDRETVDEFLKRAPVDKPSTAGLGPWLWVRSPKVKSHRQHESMTDVDAFVERGNLLLEDYQTQRTKIVKANSGAADATITRKLAPCRDQLEEDLLSLAIKTGTTCGKWMLFPANEDYPRHWRLVAEATNDGKLGPVCKAATYNDVDPINLICVYTENFMDQDDVRRVLEELIKFGLCPGSDKPKSIYYKCDAYTYLGITSSNSYKLRASLYSSREILGLEIKSRKDGPVDRLQKRNKTTG